MGRAPIAPIGTYVPPKLKSIPVVQQPKPPVPRAQIPEVRPSLAIPTPEELGIGAKPLVNSDAPVDWTMVERKLDQIGSTGYQMEKTATGFRFTVQLASGSVVGRGASKGEAVRHAMSQLH